MSTTQLNCLVIDDQFHVRRKLRELLRQLGHDSGEASTSDETLSFLASSDFNFIILGDLPGEGLETALVQEIRTRERKGSKPRAPILVIAPDFTEIEFNRTMLSGADYQMQTIKDYDKRPELALAGAILTTLSQSARQPAHT